MKFEQKYSKLVTFIAHRLSSRSYLGLHLTVGLMISAIFMWIFGGITEDILTGDPFVTIDQWVLGRVLYFRSPFATSVMEVATELGGVIFTTSCSIIIVLYLLLKKYYFKAAGFVTAIVGVNLLNLILKIIIHRPRPINDTSLIIANGWSFPSAHAMSSVVFYGMIAYLLIKITDSSKLRSFIMVMAGFIALLIGFSRIYLQVHYLSDVIAGFAGGLFWLSICITGLEMYSLKRKIEIKEKGE